MTKKEKYLFMDEDGLRALVERLMEDRLVYGPVKKHGFPAYSEITDFSELELLQTPTHLSAKEFLFPQREPLVRFSVQDNTSEEVVGAVDQAIIGLHSCDIHAIGLMDKVFGYGVPDPNYLARRQRTVLVGTDCMPDEYCFCSSVGTEEAEGGFDIFLHEISTGFLVRTGTVTGRRLVKSVATRDAGAAEAEELEARKLKRLDSFTTRLDIDWKLLPSVYQRSGGSTVWEKIGRICYGCGSCNNVCPTCYCFDVKDEVSADLQEVERVRVWDGCTLEDFARVSGGHNFRSNRAERLKHRFNRKFNYLTEKFGELFCVGCGRCSRTCLVKINIAEVTNELISEAAQK